MSLKTIPKQDKDLKKESSLVKIFYFMGVLFCGISILDIIYILIQGIPEGLTFYTVSLLFISLLFLGLSVGTASQIQKNPEGMEIFFRSFIISIFCVGIISILIYAAYQW